MSTKRKAEAVAVETSLASVRNLLDSVRAKWFPSESFAETEAWMWALVRRMGVRDPSKFDSLAHPALLSAIQDRAADSQEPPSVQAVSTWVLAYAAERNCAAAVARGAIADAIELLTVASLVSALSFAGGKDVHDVMAAMGRKASDVRHAKNRERKAQIQAWYLKNHARYRSMDRAAQEAAKLFSIGPRSAREHIVEARKNMRSTGRV